MDTDLVAELEKVTDLQGGGDTPSPGQAPDEKSSGPSPDAEEKSSEVTKTYTQEELDAAVKRATKSQQAEAKRAEKAEKDAKANREALETTRQEMEDLRRQMEEDELARYDGDDDQQSLVKKRQADRKREAELRRREQELEKEKTAIEADREEIRNIKLERTINNVAAAHGVDAEKLSEKAKRFNLTDEEGLNEIAAMMAPPKPAGPPSFTPDSMKSTGGSTKPISDDSSFEDIEHELKKADQI